MITQVSPHGYINHHSWSYGKCAHPVVVGNELQLANTIPSRHEYDIWMFGGHLRSVMASVHHLERQEI